MIALDFAPELWLAGRGVSVPGLVSGLSKKIFSGSWSGRAAEG